MTALEPKLYPKQRCNTVVRPNTEDKQLVWPGKPLSPAVVHVRSDRQTNKQTNRRISPLRKAPAFEAGLNPSEFKGNYSATSNKMKLVHWPLIGGLIHLVRRGGDWARPLYQM